MTREERLEVFLDSFLPGNTGFLAELEQKALAADIPVIRPQTQSFLRTLLAAAKPQKILEIGTAVGFSALLMCEYGPSGTLVTTIEIDEERVRKARSNIEAAGRQSQIRVIPGDADTVLPMLIVEKERMKEDGFDLVFMDAAKGQYIHWLPDVLRLMHAGSILVSDNCLQQMELIESHFAVRRRDRTIYHRMREYLFALTHEPQLQTCILPAGDGIAFSVKRKEEESIG